MKKIILLALSFSLSWLPTANAERPKQPRAPGIESTDYAWDKQSEEEIIALKLKGDVARGEIAYQVCQGCHKPTGIGLPDGSYPQLAGQHITVLIKQMVDVREGRRDNQKMFPFSGKHILETQEVADIATYLNNLPIPRENSKGAGTDLKRGEMLYHRDCTSCHGDSGEGNAEKFYPVTTGQHYSYMTRQLVEIRNGKRRNANPKMVKIIQDYTETDMAAVADYMSRLTIEK